MKKIILLLLLLLVVGSASAVNIDDVSSVSIEPGKTGVVSFNVENDHNFDVFDVSLILDLSGMIPIAPYQGSAEVFIGELNNGDDERVSFSVISSADAELGLYKIPVLISYVDEDGLAFVKTDFISVIIDSVPEIEVLLDEPNYFLGATSDVSISVINRGLANVKFLSVELLKSDFYDVISVNEIYIGDLDSDDFDNAEFKIKLNYPLPSKVTVPVKLSYYDANNNLYREVFDLRADVYSMEEAKQLGLVDSPNYSWIFIIVGLVILLIVYKIIKKKRKKRNESL